MVGEPQNGGFPLFSFHTKTSILSMVLATISYGIGGIATMFNM